MIMLLIYAHLSYEMGERWKSLNYFASISAQEKEIGIYYKLTKLQIS